MNKSQEQEVRAIQSIDHVYWRARNKYYHSLVEEIHGFLIPRDSVVAEVGPRTGRLLASLHPKKGIFIDRDSLKLTRIKEELPHYQGFVTEYDDVTEAAKLKLDNLDYVIAHGLLNETKDIQMVLRSLKFMGTNSTKYVISVYNSFWEPILKLAAKMGLRSNMETPNWISDVDVENLFALEDLEIVSRQKKILFPKYVPLLSSLLNRVLIHLPLVRNLALMSVYVLRKKPNEAINYSSTIVIPARNEEGNIENAIKRLPSFGKHQEIIFVEGNSTDGTWAEIQRVQKAYPDKDIKIFKQLGKGKGDAVRCGFSAATGDILFILDADLTVPPEDLPRFYDAVSQGKGEFANGTRLVYPMEKQAMRFLNLLGNRFFAWAFSWILGQRFKDTLCGTKVLLRTNYEKIAANRSYFGDFDPFGDFDLLFGAAKLNLKIIEIPIRYRERTYGETNISRFRHGWLLLQMCFYAVRKFKF